VTGASVARPLHPAFFAWQALWTLCVFVVAVTWLTGAAAVAVTAAWGPPLAIIVGAIAAMCGFAISASIGALATLLVGAPLMIGFSALLRHNRFTVAHVVAAAIAGLTSALIVVWIYTGLYFSGEEAAEVFGDPVSEPTWIPIAVALVVIAGASAAAGWLIAARRAAPFALVSRPLVHA